MKENIIKTFKKSSACLRKSNQPWGKKHRYRYKSPNKHLLVLKTSWRRLEDMSWRRPQHIFRVTIFRYSSLKTSWRHLERCLARRLERRKIVTLKTSSRHLEDVLKTCLEDMFWRRLEKISWRRLQDVSDANKWWYLYLANLNVYLTNLCFTNLTNLTNLGQMRHLEPNNFDIRLILKHTSISILRIKISEASEARKTKF